MEAELRVLSEQTTSRGMMLVSSEAPSLEAERIDRDRLWTATLSSQLWHRRLVTSTRGGTVKILQSIQLREPSDPVRSKFSMVVQFWRQRSTLCRRACRPPCDTLKSRSPSGQRAAEATGMPHMLEFAVHEAIASRNHSSGFVEPGS